MAKVDVTLELADTIRNLRIQNKVQANKVAKRINKSPAYISKLESGNLLTITNDDLNAILEVITNKDDSESILEQVYSSLVFHFSEEEIEEQIWLNNFDMIERNIPVPNSLRDYIRNKIEVLNISRHYLLGRINSNECLQNDIKENTLYEFNRFYAFPNNDNLKQFIKIHISEELLDKVLDSKELSVPYYVMYSILYYIYKIENFPHMISISNEDNTNLQKDVTRTLNSFKYYSIIERQRLISYHRRTEEFENILNSFDLENINYINHVLGAYRFLSDKDVCLANDIFKAYCSNLDWDLGFMMNLMKLDFQKLDNISFTNKKRLLDDISNIIEKYKALPNENYILEEY